MIVEQGLKHAKVYHEHIDLLKEDDRVVDRQDYPKCSQRLKINQLEPQTPPAEDQEASS
jgi:hypothetical protein